VGSDVDARPVPGGVLHDATDELGVDVTGLKPAIHGRDHNPTGADPAYHAWDDVGAGASGFRELLMIFDGGGAVLGTGVRGEASLDFACTITKWRLLADQVGSAVLNIWKDTYANYPPTVADKITASAPPTITSDDQAESSTLTGWTTAVAAGDVFRFNLDSVTAIQRLTLILSLTT
jgi:hypothetical protein